MIAFNLKSGKKMISGLSIVKIAEEDQKYIRLITLFYFFSHFALLILTGWWWDDYCLFFSSQSALKNMALDLGRPSLYFVISLGRLLPASAFRIATFFIFYINALLLYRILSKFFFINRIYATLIVLLYITFPANDVRALSCIFPYILGYFLFMVASYMLISYLRKEKNNEFIVRGLILALFFISFTTGSNLVFYAIPLCYILYYLISIKKDAFSIWKYSDFFAVPVVYFLLKNYFFPLGGEYKYIDYNVITLKRLELAVRNLIPSMHDVLRSAISLLFDRFYVAVLLVVVFSLWYVYIKSKNNNFLSEYMEKEGCLTIKDYLFILLIGIFILSLAIFPYLAVGRASISLAGLQGRDSLLVPLGAVLVLFSLVELLFRKWSKPLIYSMMIFCGVCHFNRYYLAYQQDYYKLLDFSHKVKENKEILSGKKNALFFPDKPTSIVDTVNVYSLTYNLSKVFNDESRFVMTKDGFKYYFHDDHSVNYMVSCGVYGMSDYKIRADRKIDVILRYLNGPSIGETFKLKILELFNRKVFENRLFNGKSKLEILLPGSKDFDSCINEADN